MKIEHDFFKFYFFKLFTYKLNRYNDNCNEIQTFEHLLLNSCHFSNKQKEMKKTKKISIKIHTLFNTSQNIKNVLNFTKNIRICRKN